MDESKKPEQQEGQLMTIDDRKENREAQMNCPKDVKNNGKPEKQKLEGRDSSRKSF